MARLHHLFAASDGCAPPVPDLRGAPLRDFHGRDAGDAGSGDMERRDRHRAVEERRGQVGEEVALEKHPGGVREVLRRMVVTLHEAGSEVQVRS